MVYLVTEGMAAGVAQMGGVIREVKAPYTTVAEAVAQALHDATLGRTPLRIEDAQTRQVLWRPQEEDA